MGGCLGDYLHRFVEKTHSGALQTEFGGVFEDLSQKEPYLSRHRLKGAFALASGGHIDVRPVFLFHNSYFYLRP
jgi:hypothetical protein